MLTYGLQLAWQRFRQRPAMVALIVLTMTVGIAACMTAGTIAEALSGEPLPGISPHLYLLQLDACESSYCEKSRSPLQSYLKLRDVEALQSLGHSAGVPVALAQAYLEVADASRPDHVDQVFGMIAEGPVAAVLGIPLRYGRSWTVGEAAAGLPVVMIDQGLSLRLFGRADGVGQSVTINHHAFRVIGVTTNWSSRTNFLDLGRVAGSPKGIVQGIWLPLRAAVAMKVAPFTEDDCDSSSEVASFGMVDVPHCRWLEHWVSLAGPGQLQDYRNTIQAYVDQQHAEGRWMGGKQIHLYSALQWQQLNQVIPRDVGLNLSLSIAFMALCMMNASSLLAVRLLRRRVEIAIRRAMGASLAQLLLQHLIESGVLGVVAGLLAWPLTEFGLWVVRQQQVNYANAAVLAWPDFLGLCLLSVSVGMVVGALPAWRAGRLAPALQIKQGG
ncbi:ABC transporter permease [Frateuria aurantia]